MRNILLFMTLILISGYTLPSLAQNITCTAEDRDMITCLVTVTGIKEKKAEQAAEVALRYALFFRGIPNSEYCKNPLVGTDENFAANHPQYFKDMFEKNRFASFITATHFMSYTKKNKVSVISFTINIKALRLDLEQQGVKRRFGL